MSPKGTVVADRIWKRFRADPVDAVLKDRVRALFRSHRSDPASWRWALRDVSVTIPPGEAVGVIGTNGSGKSTLLKILAEVMFPYAGRAEVTGRLGAMIEVRAGIHPELTGRENIFLSGSLLGLPRKVVSQRLDAIIEFAELSEAINRQVKFYSTGMQMRLGFAVAAFLEPDVLIVDEVLAVGDVSFQQRCLDRMRHVVAQGTTLVFVSHDLAAVEGMCNRGVWLRNGAVAADGSVRDTLEAYRRWLEELAVAEHSLGGDVRLVKATVTGQDGGPEPKSHAPLGVAVVVESAEARPAALCIGLSQGTAAPTILLKRQTHLARGETQLRCTIDDLPLPKGRFYLWVGVFDGDRDLLPWQPAAAFDVVGTSLDFPPRGIVRLAPVHVAATWEESRR